MGDVMSARFVELHADGGPVWLNADLIVGFCRPYGLTCVHVEDEAWTVTETPAEVLALIAALTPGDAS
jgi:hypothetical protein